MRVDSAQGEIRIASVGCHRTCGTAQYGSDHLIGRKMCLNSCRKMRSTRRASHIAHKSWSYHREHVRRVRAAATANQGHRIPFPRAHHRSAALPTPIATVNNHGGHMYRAQGCGHVASHGNSCESWSTTPRPTPRTVGHAAEMLLLAIRARRRDRGNRVRRHLEASTRAVDAPTPAARPEVGSTKPTVPRINAWMRKARYQQMRHIRWGKLMGDSKPPTRA